MWQEAERKVLAHIQTMYPQAYIIEWYCKGKDIYVPEVGISVEVKFDVISETTGNYLFEALCDGKPSWISTTESEWWVIVDSKWMKYLTLDTIYSTIIRNAIGLTKYIWEFDNDKIPMEWYLVPKQLFLTK